MFQTDRVGLAVARPVGALRAAVLVLLCLALPACTDIGYINQEAEERRYRQCLDVGGSYSTDDTDWRCDRAKLTDDRVTPTHETP